MKPVSGSSSSSSLSHAADNQNIQVFVRVRPLNIQEHEKQSLSVVECPGHREVLVKERTSTKTFSFDRVFGPQSEQVEVYTKVVSPLLDEVLKGYNCTIFAYGQTSSGKTYTMTGSHSGHSCFTWENDPLAGIVPRALSQLFDELGRTEDAEYTVHVSMLELYNEELFDLLSDKIKTLKLFDDPLRKGSLKIQSLKEDIVSNKEEVYHIMARGAEKRKTAKTLMNANSSRSHTVFTVTVHIKEYNENGEELLKIGKLNFVDLAGSENIGRSGAVSKQAREAGSINQSLLTLGRVITALVEKTPHIPYRESKLTRLLQDSLGGKTKTSIIATVSPASINVEETLNTLDYAHRAKNITNRPEINQKLSKKAMLKVLSEEIKALRRDLQAAREKNGIYMDQENYDQLMTQHESQKLEIAEKRERIKLLIEEKCLTHNENKELRTGWDETKIKLTLSNKNLEATRIKLGDAVKEIKFLESTKIENANLIKKHKEAEQTLAEEVYGLRTTVEETASIVDILYRKLEQKKKIEKENLDAGQEFSKNVHDQIILTCSTLQAFRLEHRKFCDVQGQKLDKFLGDKDNQFEVVNSLITNFLTNISEFKTKGINEIKDGAHHVVVDANEYAEHVKTLANTNLGNLDVFAQNFVLNKIHSLANDLTRLKRSIEDLCGKFKKQLSNHCTQVSSYVTQHLQKVVENQNTMERLLTRQIELSDTTMRGVTTQQKDAEAYGEAVKICAENFLAQLANKTAKYNSSNAKNANSLLIQLSSSRNDFQTFLNSMSADFEIEKAELEKMKNTATTSASTAEATLTSDMTSILNTCSDEMEDVELLRTGILENIDAQNNDWKLVTSDASERNTKIHRTMSELCESYETAAQAQYVVSDMEVKDILQRLEMCRNHNTDFVSNEKEKISSHCNTVSKWAEDNAMLGQLESLRFTKFWESEYKIEKPSCTTPERKHFRYPISTVTVPLQNHHETNTQAQEQKLHSYHIYTHTGEGDYESQSESSPEATVSALFNGYK